MSKPPEAKAREPILPATLVLRIEPLRRAGYTTIGELSGCNLGRVVLLIPPLHRLDRHVQHLCCPAHAKHYDASLGIYFMTGV